MCLAGTSGTKDSIARHSMAFHSTLSLSHTSARCCCFQVRYVCSDKAISHNCAKENWAATNLAWSKVGENVLSNSDDDASTSGQTSVQQWLGSSGHYMNAMNPAFTHVGYGYFHCPFNSGWGDMFWTGLYFQQRV
jgi:uncharacterized protein YkwD